jgi:putative nucleotidyltransferase with HDIG domain
VPRILYVDDQPFVLRAFARMLRLEGYESVVFESPADALAYLADAGDAIDVVCSDFRMPGMDGLAFLTEAETLVPDVTRVLITGDHDFRVAVDAFEAGVYRLVPKPWQREVLVGCLGDAVRTAELRRENTALKRALEEKVDDLAALNDALDERLRVRTEQVLDVLVTCLDFRDQETMAHSRRVSLLAREVAVRMGIRGQALSDIEWGAMVHDVGKIGVPDRILLKPGSLTEAEWTIMRRHVDLGAQMVSRVDFLRQASLVVAHHHERYDGKGYPNGLAGESIAIGARIFAVADAFDAITSDRPYRAAQSDEVACAELLRASGTQLDPECVDVFLSIEPAVIASIREAARLWAELRTATEVIERARPGAIRVSTA